VRFLRHVKAELSHEKSSLKTNAQNRLISELSKLLMTTGLDFKI
jgi:hypothetical protein